MTESPNHLRSVYSDEEYELDSTGSHSARDRRGYHSDDDKRSVDSDKVMDYDPYSDGYFSASGASNYRVIPHHQRVSTPGTILDIKVTVKQPFSTDQVIFDVILWLFLK